MDFESLSEEQKAKAKACTSPEELLALAKEEGYELSDEDLEGIAGGGWMGEPCPHRTGDERDEIDESLVSEAYRAGALRGDGLD